MLRDYIEKELRRAIRFTIRKSLVIFGEVILVDRASS